MKKIFKMEQIKERNEKFPLLKNKIRFSKAINAYNQLITHLFKLIINIQILIKVLARENIQIESLDTHSSYITLSINQEGNQRILGDNFVPCPDKIYINGNKISEEICKILFLNETSNSIKLVWSNEITNASYMFSGSNIQEIDFSYFNTSLIISMKYMFYNCKNLTTINFSNIDISLVTSMEFLFSSCTLLTNLDLSIHNSSSVKTMKYMFSSCTKLTSIDLSFLNTSSVTNMYGMFRNMRLTTLNLSNFDTSNVKNMGYMFNNSFKLKQLNLSNFYTSKVTTMAYMFYNCYGLKKLDTSNFITSLAQCGSFV